MCLQVGERPYAKTMSHCGAGGMSGTTFVDLVAGILGGLATLTGALYFFAGILRQKRLTIEQVIVLMFLVLMVAAIAFFLTHVSRIGS